MISSQEAKKQAKKFRVPTPNSGEFVKMTVEVLHYYMLINNLEVVGWKNGYLQVRPVHKKKEVTQ